MSNILSNQGIKLLAAAETSGVDPFQAIQTAGGTVYDKLMGIAWIVAAVVLVIGGFCWLLGSESTAQMAKKIMFRVVVGIVVLTCAKPAVVWVAGLFGQSVKF